MAHFLLDDYKIYKDIADDDSQDDRISLFLSTVEEFLKDNFGVYLLKTDVITGVYSVKNNTIVLPSANVEVVSVTVSDTEYTLDDVYLEGNVLRGISTPFTNGINNAVVDYKLGYSFVPDSLKMAVFILTARLLENSENSGESVDMLTDPKFGKTRMFQAVPSEFLMLIAPYRTFIV